MKNKVRDTQLREKLLDRRRILQTAISTSETTTSIVQLLHEVDVALRKMAKGTYGLCETCHEPIENERLCADPLARNCIEDLTQEERRMLEHDLDLAYQIQKALLPEQNLKVGKWMTDYHYEAAGPVSGDYCDLIIPQDKDGSLLFLLGDVTGKGVAASILMAHLHAIFRSLVKLDLSLDQLMARANRLFSEGTMMTHFATLVCGKAHISGEIEICNAGHCFPFLMNGDTVTRLPSTALPLGVFNAEQFSTVKVKLAPKDSLFLFSDGLSEARNKSNVQYGEKRLSTLISNRNGTSPQALISACLEDLTDFLSGAPKTDDLTIMVVQRRG